MRISTTGKVDCAHAPRLRFDLRPISALIAAGLLLMSGDLSAFAQTSTPTASAQATTETNTANPTTDQAQSQSPAGENLVTFSDQEIDQITSRIALYPDPLLELTLQAAIFPLQVVQASRFLDKNAKDPNLKPDLNWDSSVLGLLNYPVVINAMNDDLDWTEKLGQAVVNQLEAVQDSIQQFRSELYAGGVLASNDKQRVIVSKEVIAILPADAETIYVPQYDATAMQAATTASEESTAAAEESATTEVPAEETATGAQTAPDSAAAPAGTEYAAPAAGTTTAPVYSSAPVYTTTPPVAYSDPYPSFWSSAAIFLGGAAIGGLIGYGFGDDDDGDNDNNDGGNHWSRDVNIEDSNIVINRDDDRVDPRRGDVRRNDVQAELRRRQNIQPAQNLQQQRRPTEARATAPTPTRVAQGNRQQRQPTAQNRQTQNKQAAANRRPGDTVAKSTNAGALSGSKNVNSKQVKAESRRGAQSRATAANKAPPYQVSSKRPQQTLSRPSSGKQVQRQSQRGKQSGGARRR